MQKEIILSFIYLYLELYSIYFDLLHLALVTDSTRAATFHIPFGLDLKHLGVERGALQDSAQPAASAFLRWCSLVR